MPTRIPATIRRPSHEVTEGSLLQTNDRPLVCSAGCAEPGGHRPGSANRSGRNGSARGSGDHADVKNIYVQFRIFAVVLPRDYGELYLFHEQNVVARLTAGNAKITKLIAE